MREGRNEPRWGSRIHKRGAKKVASQKHLSGAVVGASPAGSEPAGKGVSELRQSGAPESLRRANLRAPPGAWRRRKPPWFHGSTACYPGGRPATSTLAGASSGEGCPLPNRSLRRGTRPSSGLRGELKPRCLTAAGNHSGVCRRLALPTSSTRSSGADHRRHPPLRACATADHLHSGGACSASGRPRARSSARRTAPWETQWGQSDRSREALPVQPARSRATGDASALPRLHGSDSAFPFGGGAPAAPRPGAG